MTTDSPGRPPVCPANPAQPPKESTILVPQPGSDVQAKHDRESDEASFGANAPPSPDAILAPLDADQLEVLRDVGSGWGPAFDADALRSQSIPRSAASPS